MVKGWGDVGGSRLENPNKDKDKYYLSIKRQVLVKFEGVCLKLY